MLAKVRRTLTMAERVLAFTRANPPDDAGQAALADRLQEALARGDVLALPERRGRAAVKVAVQRRQATRGEIHRMLRHLVRTAQAEEGGPAPLAGDWTLPAIHSPYRSYETAARALVEAALPVRERLEAAGLGATLLDQLGAAMVVLDAASGEVFAGKAAHIGARRKLETVRAECVELVELLDGVHRGRLRDDAEKLGAWEAARDVALVIVPRRRAEVEPLEGAVTPETPFPTPPVSPASGDAARREAA